MSKKISAKTIAISGILIALSVLWTWFMPTLDLGLYWSFTPLSHIFIFFAMMISPAVAVLTAAGTVLGFFLKGANYVLLMRAASHIIFVVAGVLMLKKLNIVKPLQFLIFAVATALIHAVTETAAVYIAIAAGLSIPENGMLYIWGATFAGTIGHSLLDCTFAYLISRLILKAHVVDMPPLMKENH